MSLRCKTVSSLKQRKIIFKTIMFVTHFLISINFLFRNMQ